MNIDLEREIESIKRQIVEKYRPEKIILFGSATDFEFARVNFEEGKPFFAQICFHFQQAAEKYLKSYTIAHELEFLKIHDLPGDRAG